MKKRVEAELISIAHRILKLKNKSEVDQLYKETQKLYEALSILKFYGDNYETLKNSVSSDELEEKVSSFIDSNEGTDLTEAGIENQTEIIEEIVSIEERIEIEEEPIVVGEIIIEDEVENTDEVIVAEDAEKADLVEDSGEGDDFKPSFELSFEEDTTEVVENVESSEELADEKVSLKQVTMDEIFGDHFQEPIFVKPEELTAEKGKVEKKPSGSENKVVSINDSFSRTISIGLNDRIGFVKHLFNESNEDYNRVLSQLNTFDSFEDAKSFLNEMVIPEYNYWLGKEEYLERFMEILEKKFA